MANLIHTDVLDSGLVTLTNATSKVLHICSTQPALFADVAGATLGNKSGPTVGSPAARTPSGRKVTISAISDGSVTGTGTAAYWALVDASRLLATGTLSASQAVTTNNTFTLAAFDIGIPGAA